MRTPHSPPSLADRGTRRSNQYYELRFPRMTKIYRRRDRTWWECISLEEFQRIARDTVGRERPNKEADDWCKDLFGKVASPGVKHPLRKKQREEAILADLERIEGNRRDGGHRTKDHNGRKRKRTVDSTHHPQDRRPHDRESTYLENVGQVVVGSPSRAVLFQRLGPVSPIPPVTPTRPRLSRPLAPLASVTNVTGTSPTTPPKSPLDGRGCDRPGSGKGGGSKDSKAHLNGNPDPFVDEDGYKREGCIDLNIGRPFVIPPPVPLLSPPTTTQRRKRMDLQDDADLRPVFTDLPAKAVIDTRAAAEQTTPLVSQQLASPHRSPKLSLEHRSQSIAGRSLPTPVSSGPVKPAPPLAGSPTVPGVRGSSSGVKRKREVEEGHPPSKKVGSSPSVQKGPGSSRDLKPSGTWRPDETTFMEELRSTRDISRSKTRGDMSVGAIKARLIRATSTLQILPFQKPDTTAQNPAVGTETKSIRVEERTDPVMRETIPEGDVGPRRQKVGLPISAFGIPAPFPPGTSHSGSALDRPNNSDKVATYHGADRYYSSRPPSSVTPPQQPRGPGSTSEDGKLFTSAPDEEVRSGQCNIPVKQPDKPKSDQPKSEDRKKALGCAPSFVLAPQQLLFTDTAVGKLVSTSVVWFARDVHLPEPPHRPSSLQLIPRLNEVSQLESLLVACGWHRKRSFTSKRGIERGVVFVDYEEQSDVQAVVKTHWVAQQCENAYQLATRYHSPAERGMKPIWVVDARALGWEMLRTMKPGDPFDTLEEFVLWRKE